jgi:hypothetical protein
LPAIVNNVGKFVPQCRQVRPRNRGNRAFAAAENKVLKQVLKHVIKQANQQTRKTGCFVGSFHREKSK